ncbi:hypothetical protein [Nocardia fusca]|uniref:HEPN AbiU2-like domain-containing protein n=1 Tax=Nocardia fusca TaxID=941183 RepID=A0ABV3FI21_9NOCA
MTGLDVRQKRLAEAIEGRNPRLAGMYRTALRQLAAVPEPGCETARVSIICHCVRELMLGLTVTLSDIDIPRPNPSSGSLVGDLPDLLSRHPELDLSLDQDMVPVPKDVAQQLGALVAAATQERGRNKRLAAALTTGKDDNTKHPVVKQWSDTYAFFLGWTHLDRKHEQGGDLPTNESILAALRVVEDVIDVRTTVFFDNVHAIKDLLAKINAPVGGAQ